MNSAVDYSSWKEEYKSILETFSGKNVMMLFSGGKDSSLAMDFILMAGKEVGFDFKVHAGAFPVHRYTDSERESIESYWNKRGINIIWHEVAETDGNINNAANPCFPCRKLRRELLKTIVTDAGYDMESIIFIVGYSLWDIVGYSIEHILSDIFSNSDKRVGTEKNQRFMETAQRFYPLLRMKEGYMVFRPLIKYNGADIEKCIRETNIPVLSIPCKFKEFRPKRVFEKYYLDTGIHFDYDKVLKFARRSLGLPGISVFTSIVIDEYL